MRLHFFSESHRAHMLAITAAAVRPRLTFVFAGTSAGPKMLVLPVLQCPRKRGCVTCAWLMGNKLRVEVGLLQGGLPVEMERVAAAESTAPTTAHGLPESPGP